MGLADRYPEAWGQIMWQVFCPPVGALLIFCLKPSQIQAIPLGLAFAAGVLIWVALLGLHVEGLEGFTAGISSQFKTHFEDKYTWLPRFCLLMAMIAGMGGGYIIDKVAHSLSGGHGHKHASKYGHGHDAHHDDKETEKEDVDTKDNNLNVKVNLNEPERIFTNEEDIPDTNDVETNDIETNDDVTQKPDTQTKENSTSDNKYIEMEEQNGTKKTDDVDNDTETGTKTKDELKADDKFLKQERFRSQTGLSRKQTEDLEVASAVNFMAIVLHNLPEGLSVFTATVADPKLGALVAIAFAFHEIPFGISVATPIYFSTGSKGKAIWWAFLCGCSMMIGGGIANIILALGGSLHNNTSGFIFGFVCGLMVYVAFTELIPQAKAMDPTGKYTSPLIFLGFLVMDIVFVIFDGTGGHSHGEEEDDGHNHRRLSILSKLL